MFATANRTTPRPHEGARLTQDGPVLLAAKPFDGSDAPLAVAHWLAQREDREMHVISVLEINDALALAAGAPPLPQRYHDEERSAISARMEAALARHLKDGMTRRVDVLEGASARTIADVAHDRGARVIVIGTGHHDSLGRFVYGERAMQIVRLADRPVLVVPQGAIAGFVRHAVVAVDFSPASLRAASAILPMLSAGSKLTLMHVKPAGSPAPSPQCISRVDGRCAELFSRFKGMLAIPVGVEVATHVAWGDAVTAVDAFARANGVSLIASGRRQNHSLADRLFVGSVSAGLLRRVTCPILIVPEQQDADATSVSAMLLGIETWPSNDWAEQLKAFATRNRGRQVRLSLEADSVHGGRCVAQDFTLHHLSCNDTERCMDIVLADSASAQNVLSYRCDEVTALTLFSDIGGSDTRLMFEHAGGRGTITVAPAELP